MHEQDENFQEFSFRYQWGVMLYSIFGIFLQVYSSIQAFMVPEVLYSKTSQYTAGDSLYIRSTSCHSRYDLYQVDNCLTKIMTNIVGDVIGIIFLCIGNSHFCLYNIICHFKSSQPGVSFSMAQYIVRWLQVISVTHCNILCVLHHHCISCKFEQLSQRVCIQWIQRLHQYTKG